MAIKKIVKKGLEEKAKNNVRVTKKKDKEETVLKEGVPLDPSNIHNAKGTNNEKTSSHNKRVVGMSKGCTISLGNYEFFRADCWITDHIEDPGEIKEKLELISEVIDKQLEEEIDRVKE